MHALVIFRDTLLTHPTFRSANGYGSPFGGLDRVVASLHSILLVRAF